DDSGGGLVDPCGIMSSGPESEANYFPVYYPEVTPCSCKPRRWALMTLHQDSAECPRCHLGEPAQERAAALLGDLADLSRDIAALFRDIPDTAGRALGLALILVALLGYLAIEGWLPR